MQNLKVKVNSAEESKEVQELFFELGAKWQSQLSRKSKALVINTEYPSIFLYSDGIALNWRTTKQFNEDTNSKEITIPQLKDMVVLKRNDPKDATHRYPDGFGDNFEYRGFDDGWYYFSGIDGWSKSNNSDHDKLKPIQNNDLPFIDSECDVREFLDHQGGWSYKLITSSVNGCVDRDWIEVPEGACSLTTCDDELLFWNHDETMCMNPKTESSFRRFNYGGHAEYFKMNSHTMNKLVLWRRNPQEESIKNKVVSAEGGGQKQPIKSDGGSSSYYFTKLPQHLIDEIVSSGGIEIKDIVRHCFYNDADCKDIIKALKRIQESKRGGGKLGVDVSYDANKILFFANELKNSIDSLNRELDMMREDERNG